VVAVVVVVAFVTAGFAPWLDDPPPQAPNMTGADTAAIAAAFIVRPAAIRPRWNY
jgi:hypothetical protein